jgi:DNA-binding YbaB/EbfC family protein
MNNMQQMLMRAQRLQAKIAETQDELKKREITGSSGSGAVVVVMSLAGSVVSVSIDKAVIDPEEKDVLEDLIVAALHDAKQKADSIYEEEMAKVTGGLKMPGLV